MLALPQNSEDKKIYMEKIRAYICAETAKETAETELIRAQIAKETAETELIRAKIAKETAETELLIRAQIAKETAETELIRAMIAQLEVAKESASKPISSDELAGAPAALHSQSGSDGGVDAEAKVGHQL